MPERNKAAEQGIGLVLDSGIVPDTAQVRTAVAGDTGWVDRIVRGRIAEFAHFVEPTHFAAGSGIARIGAVLRKPRPERTSLVRTRTLQIKE